MALLPISLLIVAACQSPPAQQGTGPDIRLTGIEAYRHVGEELEATAGASEAIVSPDGSAAYLEDGSVRFMGSDLRASAPEVRIDLASNDAQGYAGVTVDGPGYALTGERFDIDGEEATLTVSGGARATETAPRRPTEGQETAALTGTNDEPVNIEADQVVLHGRTNKAVFSGNVVVVRGSYTLVARTLTVTYGEDQTITHLLAEGAVRVTEAERTVTARKAEFDNIAEVLTLTGDAVLVQGSNVIHGERVIFMIRSDEVRVEKVRARVRVGDTLEGGGTQR